MLERDLYRALANMGWAWAHLAMAQPKQAGERAGTAVELLSGQGYEFFLGRTLYALGCSLATTDRDAADSGGFRTPVLADSVQRFWGFSYTG